jgi:hypothetical protein
MKKLVKRDSRVKKKEDFKLFWIFMFILIGIFILLIVISYFIIQSDPIQKLFSVRSSIEQNWNISLPKPTNEILAASTRGGIFGDGEEYNILEYDDKTIKEIKSYDFWKPHDSKDASLAGGEISKIISYLTYQLEYIEHKKTLIKQYLPVFDEHALYYYKYNDNDPDFSDYLVLVLEPNTNKVYVFEFYL